LRKTNTIGIPSYVESKKNKTNEQKKQKQTYKYREQTGGYQKGEGGRMDEIVEGD